MREKDSSNGDLIEISKEARNERVGEMFHFGPRSLEKLEEPDKTCDNFFLWHHQQTVPSSIAYFEPIVAGSEKRKNF